MKLGGYEVLFVCLLLPFCECQNQELEESEGGAFLFFSDNEEIVDESHLLKKKSECDDNALLSFLFSLQVINPESVIALSTKNKLEKICHNISKTIDHMESYLKTCALQSDQETYLHLLSGVRALHKKVCTKDPYHKAFMEYKKCFGQLQTEIDSCNGPADWSDNSDSKRVCRAYQEIADCYYIKTSVLCGNKAADIFKELVNAVIDSVITVNCTTYAAVADQSKPVNKEYQLLMQRQRISQAKNEQVAESGSPATLCGEGLLQSLVILTVVAGSKFIKLTS